MHPVSAIAFALTLTLGACGSTTEPAKTGVSRHAADVDRLRSKCRARDGVFLPTGATTGRPAQDYLCETQASATKKRRSN